MTTQATTNRRNIIGVYSSPTPIAPVHFRNEAPWMLDALGEKPAGGHLASRLQERPSPELLL